MTTGDNRVEDINSGVLTYDDVCRVQAWERNRSRWDGVTSDFYETRLKPLPNWVRICFGTVNAPMVQHVLE
jgi:hypothetical protein